MGLHAEIGVFGGSGFYDFAEGRREEIAVDTPYGPPSDRICVFSVAGRSVAFLPRHGHAHTIPPHKIDYRANLWALHSLGVTRVIAPNAVGALVPDLHPGTFVITDQFVDRTAGRADTFYDAEPVTHVSTAQPFCPELRGIAIESTAALNIPVRESGTCVTIQGPRFSSAAESRWYASAGWHIVGMTQYPEVALARELAICYVNIALVTDYDAGVWADGSGHVEAADVAAVLAQNTHNVKRVIRAMIAAIPQERTACGCADALKKARL